jgi:hypothetical protein
VLRGPGKLVLELLRFHFPSFAFSKYFR